MSKLLDSIRHTMRVRHYSYKTEKIYIYWIKKYIFFHNVRHPIEMGAAEVNAFLTHLAVNGRVSATTQNQAMFALLFLYKEVLGVNLPWLNEFTPAKRSKRIPVVLTKEEVKAIINELHGTDWILVNLLYGAGLRLNEALRLRVKDLDFGYKQIVVRDGKGGKDRLTVLPNKLIEPLTLHLEKIRALHESDLKNGLGKVEMPFALNQKYPNAGAELKWQYVFPVKSISRNPRTGEPGRHHVSESKLHKSLKQAVDWVQINKRVGCHTLARRLSYVSAFVCHPFAAGRIRHSHRAGTARTQRSDDHDDLHTRFAAKPPWRQKPG